MGVIFIALVIDIPRLEQLLKIRQQHVKGLVDMLGDGSDVCGDGHEIMIAFPAGDNMEMQVVVNSRTGCFAQIETDIDSVGMKVPAQYGTALLQEGHKCRIFLAS
jgi:hypothetical protein